MRDVTERPEGVHAGSVKLVGTSWNGIVTGVSRVLSDRMSYQRMARKRFPFGNGTAATQIARILGNLHQESGFRR